VLALGVGAGLVLERSAAVASAQDAEPGGVVRIAMRSEDFESMDPALSYTGADGVLLDTTCARLLSYASKGTSLLPEVAAAPPRISADGKAYTFTLRRGFRFSDGRPVHANAFARAIHRTLVPAVKSPWAAYTRDIVGAEEVLAGKSRAVTGVVARGLTLAIRLTRPVPEFPQRTTSLCAVPPRLPADPEGVNAYHAAGPYYVAEYRPAERIVIRRNRFYGGARPHHVDGFTVDLTASSLGDVLDRVESGEADWGYALSPAYFDPARRLAARYGVNRSRFFVEPGFVFRGYAFNMSRPLFRDNPDLRRAVNFAIDRSALRRAAGGFLESRLTDQYLPHRMPGFEGARTTRFARLTSAVRVRWRAGTPAAARPSCTRSTRRSSSRSPRASSRTSRRSGSTCGSRACR
jgi:peptide/nickel transport system substrate-binding protein